MSPPTMEKGATSFTLQSNLIVVDVTVNGRPAQFLLDTGASSTVLTRELADKLKLKEADRSAGAGAGGTIAISMVKVDSIAVAGITQRDFACPVMEMREVRTHVGQNIEGILGFDFFGSGSLLINYPGRQVTFERSTVREASGAMLAGNSILLLRFKVELTLPAETWRASTDTSLPSMTATIMGPDGATMTASEVLAHGMSMATIKASMDASVAAQVQDFELIETRNVNRAGRNAYRIHYRGKDDGRACTFVTEAIQFESGLLVLTAQVPDESFSNAVAAIESIFSSVRLAFPGPK